MIIKAILQKIGLMKSDFERDDARWTKYILKDEKRRKKCQTKLQKQ